MTEVTVANGPGKARLGMPDMKTISVGGPSAHGSSKGGAIEFLLGLIRQGIYLIGGSIQRSEAENDLRKVGARVERDLKADPSRGVLVSLRFIVMQGSPEAAGSGDAFRYTGYLYGRGRTISAARDDQRSGVQPFKPGLRSNESFAYQPVWFPPKKTAMIAELRRPFPVIAHGCFVEGRAVLQDVQWTTLQGFDDEGTTKLAGSGNSFYFDILEPPKYIVTSHGATGPVKIPKTMKMAGRGGKTIPVVELDTIIGSVTAAMVFAADAHTADAFSRAPTTKQKPLGTIRGLVNFDRLRWVRPENVRLLKSPGDAFLPV